MENRIESLHRADTIDSDLSDTARSMRNRTGVSRFLSFFLWVLIYGGWIWLMILGSQELYRDAMVPPGNELQERIAQGMRFVTYILLSGILVSGVLAILAWWWHERRTEVLVVIGITILFVIFVVFTDVLDSFVVSPIVEEYKAR